MYSRAISINFRRHILTTTVPQDRYLEKKIVVDTYSKDTLPPVITGNYNHAIIIIIIIINNGLLNQQLMKKSIGIFQILYIIQMHIKAKWFNYH